MKEILEIQKILELKDEFTYINLTGVQLMALTEDNLLQPFLDDAQNNSPTVQEFITFISEQKDIKRYTLECYVVPTNRDDTRLSIEGISGKDLSSIELQRAIENFRHADEFNLSVSEANFRAWWG